MKKYGLVLLFLLFCRSGFPQTTPEISILTCSPGDEIYSVFGHSAIRVKIESTGYDRIYNFGMFDFDISNFVIKFALKRLEYSLGIQYIDDFLEEYTSEGRSVTEQKLHLTHIQAVALTERLHYLYLPENRYYFYAFSEKNCSTEIRDLLAEVGVTFPSYPIRETTRELIGSYLERHLWLRFGINLVLGKNVDREITVYESMFLPDYLEKELDAVYINNKKLADAKKTLNTVENKEQELPSFFFSPLFIFSLLAGIVTVWNNKTFYAVLLSIMGIIGLFLCFLWIASGHIEVKNNLNILWCNPFHLIYIPFFIKNRNTGLFSLFFLTVLFASFVVWITGMQHFDTAIVPLLISLAIIHFRQLKSSVKEKKLPSGLQP